MINKSISLIFPMYNEKDYLPRAIGLANAVLSDTTNDYEILIVDDASTDGSGQMADEISRQDRRIKIFHHQKNRKLGGALKTGFYNATKDIIVYTDIDLPFDLQKLREVLPLIEEADIVKGYRLGNRESWVRKIYSWTYNWLVQFMFRLNVRDVNFAFKIFKRQLLREITLRSEGSFINAEFLAKAKRLGYIVKEVGLEYHPRTFGLSRLSSVGVIIKILFEMLRFCPEILLLSKKKVIYKKIQRFYEDAGFIARTYNFLRFKTCPFEAIVPLVPFSGTMVDLGCGTGLFLNLLRIGFLRQLFGFDIDESKIKVAIESLKGDKNINFKIADISKNEFNPPRAKCITLMDILYYLDTNGKKEILKKCFAALDDNGILLIKDIDKALNLKFLWTFLQEFLMVKALHLTYGEGLYFANKNTYLYLLKESGFVTTRTFDLSKGYFYPHILYVCKKK